MLTLASLKKIVRPLRCSFPRAIRTSPTAASMKFVVSESVTALRAGSPGADQMPE